MNKKLNNNRPALTITKILCFTIIAKTSFTNAEVALNSSGEWETSVSGSIPVFLVSSDHQDDETALRIQSGFNPANLNFHVAAPKTESGLTISAHVQIDTHLQGSNGIQNSGAFESRVAKIQINGDFGSVIAGKDFGVFNSSAIGDIGSGGGVGWLGGGADTGNATGGHIGTGYIYANFNPQIKYTSPDMGGFVFKIALINPEEPQDADIESDSTRFEGQLNYTANFESGGIKLWTGFLQQTVSVIIGDSGFYYDIQGVDVGAHIDIGPFGLTAAYTDTTGIGADGLYGGTINDQEVLATQAYVEADLKIGNTTLGASVGRGHQDSREGIDGIPVLADVAEVDNELTMLFIHHQLTPQFRLVAEVQDYQSDVQANYKAFILGAQFDF